MTALVIIIFNGDNTLFAYGNLVEGSSAVMIEGQKLEGAGLTSAAFAEYISFSGPFLAIAVVLCCCIIRSNSCFPRLPPQC